MSTQQAMSGNQMLKVIMDEIGLIREKLEVHTEALTKIREKLAGHTVRISYISAAVALVVTALLTWVMNK